MTEPRQVSDLVNLDTAPLDELFSPFDRSDSPGLVVGVAHHGIPIYRRGFGLANVELPVALTPQTRLRIGSTTKHFLCLLLMLLAEEGKLSPDDKVRKYIPELGEWADEVTLAHLMSHTSGMRCAKDLLTMLGGAGGIPEEGMRQVALATVEGNFAPGDDWSYSNGGFTLVNEVVKRVSGAPFEVQLHERILKPMGMHNTLGRPHDITCLPNSASNHLPDPQGGWRKGLLGWAVHGEGNMASTVDDMLLWLKHLSAPKVGNAETWARMRTPCRVNNGASTGYGFGLMTAEYRGLSVLHHPGGVIGCSSQMLKVLGHELDIAIMINMMGPANPVLLAFDIIDRLISGLAPIEESSGKAKPVSGEFYSKATGRYLVLAEHEGQQALQIGPTKLPLQRRADGSFWSLAFPAGSPRFHISETSVGVEEFGKVDTLPCVAPPDSSNGASIQGRFEIHDIGGMAVIEGTDPAQLRISSAYGLRAYRLDRRGPDLWLCLSTDPLNPTPDMPLHREGDDLFLSFVGIRRLRFMRVH
jgi:CubicO group peptidase (beta-lactamase class C family)